MTSIAGFRTLRTLGRGTHAEISLAHTGDADMDSAVVALKVFPLIGGVVPALREAQALSLLAHPHVISILDLATAPSGETVLVLPALDPGGLAKWMSVRHTILIGELVTAAVPLLDAVDHIHSQGVAHGRIAPHKVLFSESGAPVLVGFSSAVCTESPESALGTREIPHSLRSADHRATWAIVAELIGRISQPSAAVVDMVRWGSTEPWESGHDSFLAEARERLFQVEEPIPLRFGDGDQPPVGAEVFRVGAEAPTRQHQGAGGAKRPQLLIRRNPDPGEGPMTVRAVRQAVESLPQRLAWCREQIGGIRRGFWIAGFAGILSIGAIIGLSTSAQSTSTARTPLEADEARELGSSIERMGSVPGSETHGEGVIAVPPPSGAVSDDPVISARSLVVSREGCLASPQPGCLDQLYADPAAAIADDNSARTSPLSPDQLASWLSVDPDSLELSDLMGDTALVTGTAARQGDPAQTTTASVLMIRTEAGWRIRRLIFAG